MAGRLPSITGIEGLNPTRRYRWFRPRQAARGAVNFTSGVGAYNDVGLQNNSTAAKILVVREFFILSAAVGSGAGGWFMTQRSIGQNGSSYVENYFRQGATLPGIMVSNSDVTQQFPNVYQNQLGLGQNLTWVHDFPFAIIEPGWSLVWQSAAQNVGATLSMIWEVVDPDELDYMT